ncbi:uncharacterized protein B0T15DRAFT_542768 [Chaetomium strumarium]|uniref:Uncharacterized protein n=1 Tax=Chaetomium strumarium TaxID=1170767 RepID=A0AAJ0LYI3_9PEZI|nr:hypothetical protein B0T15DRAFT_542768 [Chaetomium strumarium]
MDPQHRPSVESGAQGGSRAGSGYLSDDSDAFIAEITKRAGKAERKYWEMPQPLRTFLPIHPENDPYGSKRNAQRILQSRLPAEVGGWIRSVEGSYVCRCVPGLLVFLVFLAFLTFLAPEAYVIHQGTGFRWLWAPMTLGHPHHEALFDASPFKKGMYLHDATGQWRPARLDRSLVPSCPVVVPKSACRFVLPFYDPCSTFATRLAQRDLNPTLVIDEDAHAAALIYLCGVVRLGDKQCQRCQKRRIGTTTPRDPIPVCVSAAPYFHGICANCFAKGGTLQERLNRCSLSKKVEKTEQAKLNRLEGPGMLGGSSPPIVGGTIEEVAFAENLL